MQLSSHNTSAMCFCNCNTNRAPQHTLVVLFSDSIERQSLQLHHTFLNSAKGSNEHFWVLQGSPQRDPDLCLIGQQQIPEDNKLKKNIIKFSNRSSRQGTLSTLPGLYLVERSSIGLIN